MVVSLMEGCVLNIGLCIMLFVGGFVIVGFGMIVEIDLVKSI